jgi:hypothetical protein
MTLVLPPNRAKEDIMVVVSCGSSLPSIVATVLEETTTGITSSNTVETGSKTIQTGNQIDPMLDSWGTS